MFSIFFIFLPVVPYLYTAYPNFHPQRSRFFNMASMYAIVMYETYSNLLEFAMKEYNLSSLNILNEFDLADENYQNWEANGGQERQLSSFKLSNRQMLWLSMAHVSTFKTFNDDKKDVEWWWHLRSVYLHVVFKNSLGFRESFRCGPMTDGEKYLLGEFNEKMKPIFNKHWDPLLCAILRLRKTNCQSWSLKCHMKKWDKFWWRITPGSWQIMVYWGHAGG